MFKVVDNFLDKEYFEEILNAVSSDEFPWYYNDNITDENDLKDRFYFTHNFYNDLTKYKCGVSSAYFEMLRSFLDKINCNSILRIKANLYINRNKKEKHNFHIDYKFSHKGCLFYLNDNNGKTYIEDKEVKPKANRAVFFDPGKEHASSACTDQKRRMNIIFNYF